MTDTSRPVADPGQTGLTGADLGITAAAASAHRLKLRTWQHERGFDDEGRPKP